MERATVHHRRPRRHSRPGMLAAAGAMCLAVGLSACGDDVSDVNVTTDVTTEVGETPSQSPAGDTIDTTGGSSVATTGSSSTGTSTEPTPVRGSVSNDAGGGTTP